ncbi:MAG: DNA alkylation repair protein [Bacteroidales bacterium]|nr:DNA alkylation repair protein [Bacteroidales bacterium]
MWLQRTVLLFQLKYKRNTDQDLLYRYIKELNSSKEFFIRKAIGWALREYSKNNPSSVLEFTANTELSPLSRREALKVILKKQNNE